MSVAIRLVFLDYRITPMSHSSPTKKWTIKFAELFPTHYSWEFTLVSRKKDEESQS